MLPSSEARISTASNPSRNTIIPALVVTATAALLPCTAVVASSNFDTNSAWVALMSSSEARALIKEANPRGSCPYQNNELDRRHQLAREDSQLGFRPAFQGRVGI